PARDYRPIGDAREIETVDRNPYKYKYNAKEWQDELGLNVYDYGARMYMPDLGRWGVHDPASEFMYDYSPYNYAYNDPISFIDEDGELPGPVGFVLGVVSDYVAQVGVNYFVDDLSFEQSVHYNNISFLDLGVAGTLGAFSGGLSSVKNIATNKISRKAFGKVVDYGIDALIETTENVLKDAGKGDIDIWKSVAGGLIEAGIGKVIPAKYVDKLEAKLLKKSKVPPNRANVVRRRIARYKRQAKKTGRMNDKVIALEKELNSIQNTMKNYERAYLSVKTVNDAFKEGGANALTDLDLFKKDEPKKGTVIFGPLECEICD
ncbi:RHS repeat-associated core domain-containing protein, partial [Weeksellaceae bacterium KMM 9724]